MSMRHVMRTKNCIKFHVLPSVELKEEEKGERGKGVLWIIIGEGGEACWL